MKNNQVFRYLSTCDEINDLNSSIRNLESYLKRQKTPLFADLVDNKFKLNSTVVFDGTGLEYKIVDIELNVDVDDNKERGLIPYVYLVRVKKGTTVLLKAYNNGVSPRAYAKCMPAHMIKEVVQF